MTTGPGSCDFTLMKSSSIGAPAKVREAATLTSLPVFCQRDGPNNSLRIRSGKHVYTRPPSANEQIPG